MHRVNTTLTFARLPSSKSPLPPHIKKSELEVEDKQSICGLFNKVMGVHVGETSEDTTELFSLEAVSWTKGNKEYTDPQLPHISIYQPVEGLLVHQLKCCTFPQPLPMGCVIEAQSIRCLIRVICPSVGHIFPISDTAVIDFESRRQHFKMFVFFKALVTQLKQYPGKLATFFSEAQSPFSCADYTAGLVALTLTLWQKDGAFIYSFWKKSHTLI